MVLSFFGALSGLLTSTPSRNASSSVKPMRHKRGINHASAEKSLNCRVNVQGKVPRNMAECKLFRQPCLPGFRPGPKPMHQDNATLRTTDTRSNNRYACCTALPSAPTRRSNRCVAIASTAERDNSANCRRLCTVVTRCYSLENRRSRLNRERTNRHDGRRSTLRRCELALRRRCGGMRPASRIGAADMLDRGHRDP